MLATAEHPSLAHTSPSPEDLRAVHSRDCSLSIWTRGPLAEFADLVDGNPRDIRFSTSLAELPAKLTEAMQDSGFEHTDVHGRFIDDVTSLARTYATTMSLDRFELRLEIVTTDSCRKWHADFVTARLITTYVGSGTQWLDASDAARVRNGDLPERVNQLGTGDVGLFKGKLADGLPAVHRSPPIDGSGERRLLLVLNPLERS